MDSINPSSGLSSSLHENFQISELNFTWAGENYTSEDIEMLNNANPGGPWYWPWCSGWKLPQHYVFQIANLLFVISYAAPNTKKGQLFLHSMLILGFIVYSVWAWHMICAPDVFSWNFAFVFLNVGQLVSIIYMMRPVKFDPELEEVYHTLFRPFKVSRLQFKRMVSPEFAQIMSLHAGEAYAMQNLTKTDRLGLLLHGKVNVMSGQQFLHPILPCEFLDSPEFESSRATVDEKFKVSIVAASSCRYLYWQRSSLEYLFVKETYLATVVTTLIARDITTKLYAMNNKIVTDKGSHLDIRLPSITGTLTSVVGEYKSPPKIMRAKHLVPIPISPDSYESGSKERLFKQQRREERAFEETGPGPAAATAPELEPLAEPSSEDLTSTGLDSWHDTSSKYHSCEAVETDDELKQP